MRVSRPLPAHLRVSIAVIIVGICAIACVQFVQAQTHAEIGTNSPLPVFVTNLHDANMLPDGFVAGSRWRFTTWTTPSVLTWTATVNRTSGPWASLTIVAETQTTTRWYYVPAMPGSWERE